MNTKQEIIPPAATAIPSTSPPVTTSAAVVIPDNIASYEDGVKAVEAALASSDVTMKDDVLRKVLKLFNTRIAKRSSDSEKDGVATVKRSLESNRRFYGQLRSQPNPVPSSAS